MREKIAIVIILLAISSLLLSTTNAQSVSDIDSCFENVRGQLLSIYSSQITAHAGIILGLIVAVATIGTGIIKAVGSHKIHYNLLGLFTLSGMIFLLMYESGRLFYWSGVSSVLTYTNAISCLNETGSTIVVSNVTSYMALLNTYAINMVMSGNGTTSVVAQAFYPDIVIGHTIWLYALFITPMVVLGLVLIKYRHYLKRK